MTTDQRIDILTLAPITMPRTKINKQQAASKQDIEVVRKDLKKDIEVGRKDLMKEIDATKTELKQDLEVVRKDLMKEIDATKTELKQDLEIAKKDLMKEIQSKASKQDLADVRTELRQDIDDLAQIVVENCVTKAEFQEFQAKAFTVFATKDDLRELEQRLPSRDRIDEMYILLDTVAKDVKDMKQELTFTNHRIDVLETRRRH